MSKAGSPVLVGAGATVNFDKSVISGFLCTTTGTITINRIDKDGTTTLVTALPVTAGQWVDIPMKISPGRGQIVSASAVGVLIAG